MARSLRIEYPGAFYHVTSRGNEQRDVFKTRKDREQFLSYLESAVARYGAVIHAYCLMSNHYHLIIETPSGNLSEIMRHINGAYTTYFNVKRKRAGHLFQGRYKAIVIEANTYAMELSRYIHLNPVRVRLVDKPEDYEWSSHRCYIGETTAGRWLSTGFILGYFGKKGEDAQRAYRSFVDCLSGTEYVSPLTKTVASCLLGDDEFVEDITANYLENKDLDRNLPSLRELSKEVLLDKIEAEVDATLKGARLSRAAKLYLCHRYSGATLKEIGLRHGLGESAVSQASHRFGSRIESDAELKKQISEMAAKIKHPVCRHDP